MDLDNMTRVREEPKIPESSQRLATAGKPWWWQVVKAAEETEKAEERHLGCPSTFVRAESGRIRVPGRHPFAALRAILERPFALFLEL